MRCLAAVLVTVTGALIEGGAAAAPSRLSAENILPVSSPPARTLLHANLLEASPETRLALTVLQGLVNRERPRILLTQDPGWHGPHGIPKWIEGLRERGYRIQEVSDPLDLVRRFRHLLKGAVLYEAELESEPLRLHKLNVLTLYCALESALPVTPELQEKLELPVLLDARGRFDSPGEAYEWAYKELWPRASRRAVAFLAPRHIVLRDYLVAHRIVPFWISHGMDREAEEICLRFLDEAEPNAAVLGCWGGYGEQPPGRVSEDNLQRLASLRGKFVVVSDGCFNLTVHSGLRYAGAPPPPQRPAIKSEPGKVYVVFSVTDGDNLQYLQQHFRSPHWWEDPRRGEVPIGWSLNPLASVLMPDVMEFLQKTCTENDEFFCSTAGIGLIAPALYAKDLYSDPAGVYRDYVRISAELMRRTGLDMIQLGDTSNIPWTRADFADWAQSVPALHGILGDYGRAFGVHPGNAAFPVAGGTPVLRSLIAPGRTGPDENTAKELAEAIRANAPKERPAFMHVCLVNWFHTPATTADAVKLLGDEFVPVLPSQMFDLLRKHLK